jgi:ABC-type Fe3+/spermidine/putrescine transport system ATPase subunit
MVAGLERPDSGSVHIDGQLADDWPPVRRGVGIVFQSYALFPNLSAEANIGYGLAARGERKARVASRVREMLDLVGLGEHRHKLPSQLSGGQQQRVALARALAGSPSILLLDEPLSALDAKVRASLRAEVRGIAQRLGVTTLMVTHDQEEALEMADRVVVMNEGRIEQDATPEEIYRRPATRFVADFVGQMNVLPATLRDGFAVVGGGRVPLDGTNGAARHAEVGFRPEDCSPAADNDTDALALRVQSIRFLGATIHAIGEIDGLAGSRATVALRDSTNALGSLVRFHPRADRLRVFELPQA